MKRLPKYPKFAKLRYRLFGLAAISAGAAGLIITAGLFRMKPDFSLEKSVATSEPRSDALREREAESLRREESLLRGLPFQQALAAMQSRVAVLESAATSPTKLGKNGILTITDSGIIKPTDHNQTQGGIGTDVSRIGKIWGTFMDLNDDVSINGKLDLSGKLTANGVVTLGNNSGDTIEVGGRFTSNLVPSQTNAVDIGTSSLRWRSGYFVNSIVVGSGTTTITDSGITTTGGNSTSITSTLLNLISTGTLQLDTSTNNTNIVLLPGTGNIGVGSTAPVYKLDVVGTLRTTSTARVEGALTVTTGGASVTGDLTLDGDLDFTGAQNITTTADNLTLSPTGNLIIDTSGGTVAIRDAGIDLTGQPTTISGSTLTLRSTGSFIIDTSANNTNIQLSAGTGTVNVSAATARLTGNLIVTGTETFNGVTYTFPGADGSASNVLTTSGTGLLSWGTLGAASITADSLDFSEFKDEMTLDADTSINGDQSLIIRAGLGAVQNSTSGNNDIQLAAEDRIDLYASSYSLTTSGNSVDILSAGRIDLSAKGTLTLDTSQNNTNILLKAGSGSINLSSGTTTISGNVNLNSGTLTLNGLSYTFPGSQSASAVLLTDGSGILSWSTGLTGASLADDTLDFVDLQDELDLDADTTVNGDQSLVIRTGLGARQNATSGSNDLQLSAEDKLLLDSASFRLATSSGSAGDLQIISAGTLQLDTSTNNTNILVRTGSGQFDLISNRAAINAISVAATNGGIDLSTSGVGGLGELRLRSGGSLKIDTSGNNNNILIDSGTGDLLTNVGTNTLSAVDDTVAAIGLSATRGGITLSSSSASGSGDIRILSGGTLRLSTSANNSNILLQAGSGNINLSSTGTTTISGNVNLNSGTLTLNGLTYTFPGSQSANGVLLTDGSGILSWSTGLTGASLADDTLDFVDFQDELDLDADTTINGDQSLIIRTGLGSIQNSTSGSNDLQLSAEDKLILGAASFDLLTSSGAVDIISASYLDLSSRGTLTLDTSQNNTNIQLSAGTGTVNLSAATARLTGNLIVTGTETFNGVTYTFPGADGSSGQALTTNASGILSWSSVTPADDSLDFSKFEDSLDMDTDTLVNGDFSLVLRAGAGALQNSSSGSNDLQLSAEDKLIFDAASFTMTASNGPIDILSRGYLDLSSTGTLTLDTSQNNTNIALRAGTGNVQVSANQLYVTGNLVLTGTAALNGVTYTFPGADGSASQALTTNASGILSWSTIGVSADSLDFTDFKDVLTMDSDTAVNGDYSFILRAGLGAIQNSTSGSNDIQLAAEDRLDLYAASYSLTTSGNSVDILSGGRIDLSAKGTLTLDTSQNNSQILVRAGTGRIDLSGNTILVNAGTGSVTLSSSGSITIGGEGATTRVSGDLNFTGRLMEDGNEVLGNIIAAYNGSCPTGWTEYTAARGRTIVGTPASGTNAGTVGSALTDLQDKTHTHTGPSHTHPSNVGGSSSSFQTVAYTISTDGSDGSSVYAANGGGAPNRYPLLSGVSAAGTAATGTAATSDVIPYIQLTYCQKTAGADLAEWISSDEDLSSATILSIDPNNNDKVVASRVAYDPAVVGILATQPGWLIGSEAPGSVQMALAGRVPTRVSLLNGEIKRGDPITTSSIPGVGMKATKAGAIIGKAMEPLTRESSLTACGEGENSSYCGTITVFVNPSTYIPENYDPDSPDQLYLTSLDGSGNPIIRKELFAGQANLYNATVGGKLLLKKGDVPGWLQDIPASGLPDDHDPLSSNNRDNLLSIEGDANITGRLAVDTLQVTGKLITPRGSDMMEAFDSMDKRIASVSAQVAEVDLLKSRVSGLEDLVNLLTLSTSTGANVSLSQSTAGLTLSASTDVPFSIHNSVFSILSPASIGGSLTVGATLIEESGAISTLGSTLNIQPLIPADISFLGGKVLITKSGDLQINSGKIAGNSSFRDQITLPAGQGSLRVDTSWDTPPVTINVTPTWNTTVWIEDITGPALNPSAARGSGFTVRVSAPPSVDSKLFWLALW